MPHYCSALIYRENLLYACPGQNLMPGVGLDAVSHFVGLMQRQNSRCVVLQSSFQYSYFALNVELGRGPSRQHWRWRRLQSANELDDDITFAGQMPSG